MEIVDSCERLLNACLGAGQWVARNGELVQNERRGLERDLRKAARTFRGLARGALRKMCAGVFGPSQAGKSYLISALASGEKDSLAAVFGSETRDFLSEINPEGGKEATGLVTRFTMDAPGKAPGDHPVMVRLLSETDIVKILANSYFSDAEMDDETATDIEGTLAQLGSRAARENGQISLDDMEDLREYVSGNFRSRARAALLENSFWDQAVRLAPRLSPEDRATLYSLIFDGLDQFDALLRKLLGALESLGHAGEAFLPMDALIPREMSIIDVETLRGLERDDAEGQGLDLIGDNGRRVTLPRAVVAALAAELTIVMRDLPAAYFNHTDLLDFPGYRSRYKFGNLRHELAKPGILQGLFLRGKVAYLFQRYCAERELTSMLLCIGPGNQEVQDLPGVISRWIESTQGASPEERADKATALFFILTKYDMDFEIKSGAPDVEKRWDNRLRASLLNFFGQSHDWPREWTPGQPFNNIFLLRNPAFRFDAILDYDASGREKGIRPDMRNYVAQLEQSFLASSLVNDHIRNPKETWDAAMRLNDGGISHIRDALSPLCDPGLKEAQLKLAMRKTSEAIARRLAPFYHPDDRDELRRQKEMLLRTVYARLGRLESERQRLGELLTSLTIREQDIYDLYPQAERSFYEAAETESEAENPSGPEEADEQWHGDFDEINPFARKAEQKGHGQIARREITDFFADFVLASWVDRLRSLAGDQTAQKFFMLDEKIFTALVDELSTGCMRLGLRQKLAGAFRQASAFAAPKDKVIWQQASEASHAINSYVDWLGLDPAEKSEAERSIRTGREARPVFSLPADPQGLPVLGPEPVASAADYFADWLRALAALVIANVNYDGQTAWNAQENAQLGEILGVLRGCGQ